MTKKLASKAVLLYQYCLIGKIILKALMYRFITVTIQQKYVNSIALELERTLQTQPPKKIPNDDPSFWCELKVKQERKSPLGEGSRELSRLMIVP